MSQDDSNGEICFIIRDLENKFRIFYRNYYFALFPEIRISRVLQDGPYLKCLSTKQGHYVLAELHEGICGNHPGGRTLAHRAHTQRYYWPTMRSYVADYVRKCDQCQRLAPILRSPAQDLISITSPWPFAQWGIDIVKPLPIALAQKKLLLVATNYFNKWIEAEAFASIKDKDVIQFIWKNIVYRFGIPRSIVSNNEASIRQPSIQELLP